MSYIIFIPTWIDILLKETLASIGNQPVEVFDNKKHDWAIAKCWNYAINKYIVDGDYETVIISNDDVTFQKNTAQVLHEALTYGNPPGPEALIVSCYDTRILPDNGPMWRTERYWAPAGFFCFAVNRKLVEKVGWFDETFYPAYFEDTDMVCRIKLAGCEVYSLMPAYHHSGTTHKCDPDRAVTMRKHDAKLKKYYLDKWGGLAWQERYMEPFNPDSAAEYNRRERESITDFGKIIEFAE